MIKLVTIDLDGTLLDKRGNVSDYTKSVLKKAKEKGCEIVLASGRPVKSTLTLAKDLGIDNYIISGNGAILYDVKNDEILFKGFLKKEKGLEIIDICEKNSIYYNIYTDKAILTNVLAHNILFYHKENKFKPEDKRTNINIVQNIRQYIEDMNIDSFMKMTICDSSKIVFDNIMKKIKKISGIEVLDTSWMSRKIIKDGTNEVDISYYFTEISKAGITKWNAVNKLMKKLDIDKSEVMSIGDNFNDISMLNNAGIGVAMQNSGEEVKSVSNYITDTNESDGVAKAIEKFVLNN